MFQSALTTNSDWQIALETCVKQVSSGIPANLGFIYITELFSGHLTEILHALHASTNIDCWVGSVGINGMWYTCCGLQSWWITNYH